MYETVRWRDFNNVRIENTGLTLLSKYCIRILCGEENLDTYRSMQRFNPPLR